MLNLQQYPAANLMTANTQVYGVAFLYGGPTHLTIPALGQTLCQMELWPGVYQPASFGADGCTTCQRLAQVRDLELTTDPLPV